MSLLSEDNNNEATTTKKKSNYFLFEWTKTKGHSVLRLASSHDSLISANEAMRGISLVALVIVSARLWRARIVHGQIAEAERGSS